MTAELGNPACLFGIGGVDHQNLSALLKELGAPLTNFSDGSPARIVELFVEAQENNRCPIVAMFTGCSLMHQVIGRATSVPSP